MKKICRHCENVFTAIRKNIEFCSVSCRNKAYYERRLIKEPQYIESLKVKRELSKKAEIDRMELYRLELEERRKRKDSELEELRKREEEKMALQAERERREWNEHLEARKKSREEKMEREKERKKRDQEKFNEGLKAIAGLIKGFKN